jgi:hypothetical protein
MKHLATLRGCLFVRACHQFSWRAVGPAKIQVNNASAHDSLDGQACIWSTKYKLSVALPINEHGLLQIEFRYWEDLMLASARACFIIRFGLMPDTYG